MGLQNASASKSHLIIALPPSLSPSSSPQCQIPFHVSGEQETFNKTSLIEFSGKELCVLALCLSSLKDFFFCETQFVKRFYSPRPNWCFGVFYVSRPDKNWPHCAFYALASSPKKIIKFQEQLRATHKAWSFHLTAISFNAKFTKCRI